MILNRNLNSGCPTGIEPASPLPQSGALPLSYGHHLRVRLPRKNSRSKPKYYQQFIVPGRRIELRTPASSKGDLDYIITQHHFFKKVVLGVGRCLQEYRWDSPASLYTFRKTSAPYGPLSGLARDCSSLATEVFPEFTRFFNPHYCEKPRRLITQGGALPMS